MKLQIKVDESSGEIVDACFKTFGCGSAIASSSLGKETLVWLLVPWGVSMCVMWIGVPSANVFAYLHSSPSGVVLLLGRGLILWLCGSFGVDQGKAYEWGNKHKEQVSWIQCYHAKSRESPWLHVWRRSMLLLSQTKGPDCVDVLQWHSQAPITPTCEAALQYACRGCHQSSCEGLQAKEGKTFCGGVCPCWDSCMIRT